MLHVYLSLKSIAMNWPILSKQETRKFLSTVSYFCISNLWNWNLKLISGNFIRFQKNSIYISVGSNNQTILVSKSWKRMILEIRSILGFCINKLFLWRRIFLEGILKLDNKFINLDYKKLINSMKY